jgi:hypothetical protein
MSHTNGQSVVLGNGSAVVDDCELVRAKPVFEPPTVYRRLCDAMGNYRTNQRALHRVLELVTDENVLPTSLLERKISEQIERKLVQHIASIARIEIADMRRVKIVP